MQRVVFLLFCCCWLSGIAAPDKVRDSLMTVLEEQTGTDRLNTLLELSDRLLYQLPDEAIVYADEAYRLAVELRETGVRYKALKTRAYANNYAGNITRSISDTQEGLDYYSRIRDTVMIAETMSDLGQLYLSQGIYDKALEHFQQAYTIREAKGDKQGMAYSLNSIGSMYWRSGKYDEALEFFRQAIQLFETTGLTEETARTTANMGEIYFLKNNTDMALEYFNKAMKLNQNTGQSSFRAANLINIGKVYLQRNQPQRAISYFRQAMSIQQHIGDREGYAQSHYHLGLAWLKRNDAVQALEHFNISIASSKRINNNDIQIRALEQSARIYYQLEQYQVASDLLFRARSLSDSIFNIQQTKLREELNTRYETEKYMLENRNLKLSNQTNETIINQQRTMLILTFVLSMMAVVTVILFMQRRRAADRILTIEMEQKLLRSQMNPHFVYNSLTVIQSSVMKKTAKEAVNLISSMASLMRLILDNSTHEFIPFEKEIQTLRYYLELQQQRFAGQFEYKLEIDKELEDREFHIPPMLAQPFIENAIEHGFAGITYPGMITLRYHLHDENQLQCRIEDNGIGYNEGLKKEKEPQHRSYGIEITRQRIGILQKRYNMHAALEIIDKNGENEGGTIVKINIPLKAHE
jgi:tetratricopeptide (TPR) repeat protein